MGLQGGVDMRTVYISSARMPALLANRTSLTKHKFKDKIKIFMMVTTKH